MLFIECSIVVVKFLENSTCKRVIQEIKTKETKRSKGSSYQEPTTTATRNPTWRLGMPGLALRVDATPPLL